MKLPKVPQSVRRVATVTAIGAGLGYLASKGAFIDPGMPDALRASMSANLPDSGTASAVGGALGLTGQTGYEAGKHHALNKTQFK